MRLFTFLQCLHLHSLSPAANLLNKIRHERFNTAVISV